jgi:hypothetical protein
LVSTRVRHRARRGGRDGLRYSYHTKRRTS